MWAVGENFVAAMEFGISGFYSSGGKASAHLFCSGWAQAPQIVSRGGGAIRPKRLGPSLGQISILKS